MVKIVPKKGTLEYGAWNALANALKVRNGEKVVVITDKENIAIGKAFAEEASNLAGRGIDFYSMEQLGTRPLTSLPEYLEDSLKNANVTIYAAGTQEGELAFRSPMIKTAVSNGARHGHAVGVNEQIMLSGMQADIESCNKMCSELYNRLNGIDWMRITSPAGTDVTLEFMQRISWINSDWNFSVPREWHNLPSGEVFTWPARVNGVYIVDGVLGDHFDQKYGDLGETPVRYKVQNGIIKSVDCPKNLGLEGELRRYVFDTHNGTIIGEVGIGALEFEGLTARMLQDEKKRGTAHIAHGSTYSERTGAPDYGQTTHCDGIMLNVTLETGRGTKTDIILKDGIYRPRED
ncbi:aminopeptidase [Candidatus Pacearchaeota archaeon]|nr:aminopeptidase [Candidatus Pacearchaeota archaeon]